MSFLSLVTLETKIVPIELRFIQICWCGKGETFETLDIKNFGRKILVEIYRIIFEWFIALTN